LPLQINIFEALSLRADEAMYKAEVAGKRRYAIARAD
jgi:PleD family two-component response regulator